MIKHIFSTVVCILAIFSGVFVLAQEPVQPVIEFSYDDSGNRTARHVVTLNRSMNVTNDSTQNIQQDSAAMGQNIWQPADNNSEQSVIIDNMGNQQINVYPNPTAGILTIQISPFLDGEKAEIQIFDQQNKLLSITPCTSEFTKADLSSQAKGIYLMNVVIGGKMSSWKIVKE